MMRSALLRRSIAASLGMPAPKSKRCAKTKGGCGQAFLALRPLQAACSPACAASMAAIKRERAERAADRAKREKLKPRAAWLAEAQIAVNRYVRMRDARLPCVSCDRSALWPGQWHASHLRSVGAASSVRFHLWNIHKACSICNNHLSGNLAEYEPRLRMRIGAEKIEWLRAQNGRADYSIDYLKRLKRVFAKKARRLERRRAGQ